MRQTPVRVTMVYEALPFVYLGAGIATERTLHNSLSWFPTTLFITAALLAIVSRISYRKRQRSPYR